ncbi:MAG: thioredoxin domain-containing protein [Wenzhouxiangellaceae bacterium]|nr:thioredoxin domain-containing protein [Wenzhouxiangellaceae bacterium]
MANRLQNALSPYLEQHADNPVDWYPWGPEALQLARTSDRPILLSIGYSACHWCHVMAAESFEDPALAARMNAWFVNIKVDREERPDLDRIYQLAHQLLTGRGGGWPLTVFLDPTDLAPFVAGTYFPPEAGHGLIGFDQLLERVHEAWLEQRDTLKAQNTQLQQALTMVAAQHTQADPEVGDPAELLIGQLSARFDARHGGFGDAPKFPQAPLLAWLLSLAGSDEQAAQMLTDTLQPMARNGLFDHLAGGFFRYSIDAAWEIPHFEKMLCDSALLLPIYAEAAVLWNDRGLQRTAEQTATFLLDDMQLAGGGFASSLDADSRPDAIDPAEPEAAREGAYYLWTRTEFGACLDRRLKETGEARFGLDGPANFEGRAWHLVIARSIDELTTRADEVDSLTDTLEQVRIELLACRRRRPKPARDEKMVASWNAHAVIGLARAGRALGREDWIESAAQTLDATWQRLFDGPQEHAVWRDGRSAHAALLDDFAGLLLASMEMLACRWRSEWLEHAEFLAQSIRHRFLDPESSTLYLTPMDHERLLMRPTANTDDATPSGAAMAVRGMLRLGHLVGDAELLQLAERLVEAVAGDMQRTPGAYASMLLERTNLERPTIQVLIGGPGTTPERWAERLRSRRGLLCYQPDPESAAFADNPAGPLATVATAERPTAIVCAGHRCLEPAFSMDDLERRLAGLLP